MDDGIVRGSASEFEAVRPLFVRVAAWTATTGNAVGVRAAVGRYVSDGIGGCVGDGVRVRTGTPATATAESAPAYMHPVFDGGTHDDKPEEFRVGRDREFGSAGGF